MPRKTHRPATVAALLLSLFMAAMEMTVVSTAMPTVISELGGALHYAWVFTAYMLASTVCVPIYGKLADLHGRKPWMLVAIGLFLIGSMASGQARSLTQLVVFRAVQGVGAGGMQPLALTIVGDVFKIEERAKMQGLFGAVWAIAGLVGPLLGGLIVATLSWRWVFYVNVPFGVASVVVLSLSLVEEAQRRPHGLDFAGAGVLALAVIALLLSADGVAPMALLPTAAALTALFVAIERRAKEPIVPLALFTRRALATSSGISATAGAAMIGLVTFVPLYAQGVLGATPTEAGATIAPMAVSWPIASAISGRLIARFGFRALVRAGVTSVAITGVALALLLARGATLGELRFVSVAFGIGMGLSNTPLLIAVQTNVDFSQRGVATASTMFFRHIGGTVGVGVMGALLSRALLSSGKASAELVGSILGPDRRSVDPAVLRDVAGDLSAGLGTVAWWIAGLGMISAFVALAFPHVDVQPRMPDRGQDRGR